jgi:germination protein M
MHFYADQGRALRAMLVAAVVTVIPLASLTTAAATPVTATPALAAQAETRDLFVYLLRDGDIAAARRPIEVEGGRVGHASLVALLDGPTDEEQDAGLTSGIPVETELLDVTLDNATDVATVDLNDRFLSPPRSDEPDAETEALIYLGRMAQVVYTLTQFSTITAVTFEIEGKPLTDLPILETIQTNPINGPIDLSQPLERGDLEPVTPAIFVERPAVGEEITFPVRVAGTANTFEAAFVLQIRDDDGVALLEQPVTATSGSGTRGTFDITLDPGPVLDTEGLTLIAFELSARDGAPINQVEVPLTVAGDAS